MIGSSALRNDVDRPDLGVVDAEAGAHTIVCDKRDDNPLLAEGVVLVPEDEYNTLEVPDRITTIESIESIDDLDCSDSHPVRYVPRNAYLDPAANGPHADLNNEELFELLGLEELAPPSPDGLGGRFGHIAATLAIVLSCALVICWRTQLEIHDESDTS